MKKILTILLILSYFGISSCVIKTKDEAKNKTEESWKNTACDEFLKNYEDIMNEYLNVIDEYFNNPADEKTAARYMELMQEALDLANKWEGLIDCADDEKYSKKFEEISNQVAEKLENLGL